MLELLTATGPEEIAVIANGLFFLVGMLTGGGVAILAFKSALKQ